MIFTDSVLPAPLSPEMRMDWLHCSVRTCWYAASAMAYTCGASAPNSAPR